MNDIRIERIVVTKNYVEVTDNSGYTISIPAELVEKLWWAVDLMRD